MKIPRISPFWLIMGNLWLVMGWSWLPSTAAWVLPFLGIETVWVGLGVYSFVTEDPKKKAARLEAEQVARIRELEKELGFEPLELGDPTAPPKEQR